MEPGHEIDQIGSAGRPVSMVEVEIRYDTGINLPAGAVGEICMCGPKVTRGYRKDPERTAAAMHPDGFLRSGDMGYLDAEGLLYLTDRKNGMIISGGENIASCELERVIFQMPQVADVAVIAKPDEKWGEAPMAIILPQAGQSLGDGGTGRLLPKPVGRVQMSKGHEAGCSVASKSLRQDSQARAAG